MRNTKFSLVWVLAVIAVPAMAQDMPLPGPRPFDQMRGGCDDFAMDVGRERAAWTSPAIMQVAASPTEAGSPLIAAGQVTRLALHPHADVTFMVAPEQDRGAPDRLSGHARVMIPAAGLWRVAASNGLWFDAVVAGALIPSAAFEMQTGCRAPFKVVVFDLPAGEVALQFNGSPAAEVEVVVLPWAEQ